MATKPKALGTNPLSKGIFQRTSPVDQESLINIQENRFLIQGEKEKVNLRLPVELNDWLDDLLKKGKRTHGQKIPKEVWVQAALEFFRALPINWLDIESEDSLRGVLESLESRLKKKDS